MKNKLQLYRTLLDQLPFGLLVYKRALQDPEELTYKDLSPRNVTGIIPILHSPEMLIQPILEGGKIPMIEITKLAFPVEPPPEFFEGAKLDINEGCVNLHTKIQFSYNIKNAYFAIFANSMQLEIQNYQKLYDQLDEWHFNRRGVDKNQYIEKSTLVK